jgi:hypothetical protein
MDRDLATIEGLPQKVINGISRFISHGVLWRLNCR